MHPDIHKYPRTPHLEGSNLQAGDDKDRVAFRDIPRLVGLPAEALWFVWEEKVDGANCAFSFLDDLELRLQSRGHYLTGGGREIHFDAFKQWAHRIEGDLFDVLGDRYIVYAEYMRSKHTVFYDQLPHYVLEFDVLDKKLNRFLSTSARRAILGKLPIHSVPVLYAGPMPKHLSHLTKLVGRSAFKSDHWREALRTVLDRQLLDVDRALRETENSDIAEGGYLKVEHGDYVVARYKWVRGEFVQTILENDSHWLSRPIIPNGLVAPTLFECPPPVWDAGMPLLTREAFADVTFARSKGKCVFCDREAVDAHHIMDRKLFPDGGYYSENGAAVCAQHHLDCEQRCISVEAVRKAAGVMTRVLPPGFDPAWRYDKWGRRLEAVAGP